MDIKAYLEKYQEDFLLLMTNSLKMGLFAHAYLIAGNENQPLLKMAQFLAQSLFCQDPDPFACQMCSSCTRFKHQHLLGYFEIDGTTTTIKKEDIQNIIGNTKTGSVEKDGITVVVINNIQNITHEAINSFLKFLEEPNDAIYFLLTTTNFSAVLPTITSRTQVVHLKPKCLILDEETKQIPLLDFYLLSPYYDSAGEISEIITSKDYFALKNLMLQILDGLLLSLDEFAFKNRLLFIPYLNNIKEPRLRRKQLQFYLKLLESCFKNVLLHPENFQNEDIYDIIIRISKKDYPLNHMILATIKARSKLSLNLKETLLLDSLFISFGAHDEHI
ncbi:MAG: DNA polymerase III subunit [Erysipelotrichaceae bacterium]|jgi:DNA polymerase-3 subunit delta'|nr:DNA polymerase III subunit [Erysipelotrichaceae bacterium]